MLQLQSRDGSPILSVKAVPGARRAGVVGLYDGGLKIAVTVAPEKGKANVAIAAIVADVVGLSPRDVELISGQTARNKRFLLHGLTEAEVRRCVESVIGSDDR